MTRDEIDESLQDIELWTDGPVDARERFAEAMKGRQYGYEPLVSAWCWFLDGWIHAGGEDGSAL